ncbi:cache domain-containing sensor histidine kinase [Cohnella silvisoli]|uniref:Sensor histidine kinase n=1 Tax=Cohnella silvisoli TaxID=2873699 RepID=A0ABV1KNA6_9BACL|nr:sensor histidine kinase [Cohnella silvisoli]MCD9021147.1 sensor histidine kinase [Cohnella silvisoli]
MIRKFREYISISTIRGKFFWLTTTLVVIPMIILSTIFYNITADKFGSNAKDHALSSLNMANLYMDQVIKDVNDLMNVILGNQELQAILADKEMDDYAYLRNVDKISKMMNVYTQSKPFITSYLIYAKNGSDKKHFYRGTDSITFGSRNIMSPEKANNYYKELSVNNTTLWINKDPFGNDNEIVNSQRMVVGKLLKKTGGNYDDLGFIMLEIDKDAFFKGLQFLNPTEQSQLFVWGDRGELLYHMPQTDEPIREQEVVYKIRNQKLTASLSKQQVLWDGKKYFGASVDNERTGWSMITMIEGSKLLEDANKIGAFTIQTFLFVLIIGWMFALLFGNSIRLPLSKLRSMMVLNPYVQSLPTYQFKANDEVSQIGEKFLRMMEENRELNDQVYDALLKRKEAEIQVLQAQINPHFLYNTLESLNGFAVSNNQPEMSEVIGALGKFFRITLSRGNDLITVADEVEHVSSYVKVQQFRFKDKFDWICEVDEKIAQYRVPKLLLQPLVENAIYHGLKGRTSPGMIMLSGELSEQAIKFSVSDDGPGISEERLQKIVDALSLNEQGEIYGLKNVHDRIFLRFGVGYGLEIKSEAGKYTTVSITIPLLDSNGQMIENTA